MRALFPGSLRIAARGGILEFTFRSEPVAAAGGGVGPGAGRDSDRGRNVSGVEERGAARETGSGRRRDRTPRRACRFLLFQADIHLGARPGREVSSASRTAAVAS